MRLPQVARRGRATGKRKLGLGMLDEMSEECPQGLPAVLFRATIEPSLDGVAMGLEPGDADGRLLG